MPKIVPTNPALSPVLLFPRLATGRFGSYGAIGIADDAYRANRADYKTVVPGYLETLGIELVTGRTLTLADAEATALPVAVIDEKLAEKAFWGEDPIQLRRW